LRNEPGAAHHFVAAIHSFFTCAFGGGSFIRTRSPFAIATDVLPIEDAIFEALAATPPGKSIDPAEVAKALQPERWQRLLPQVRATAVGLARAGRLVITRHGKPADPDTFKGVWRMRLPEQGETP
jgi:hypothetical protein